MASLMNSFGASSIDLNSVQFFGSPEVVEAEEPSTNPFFLTPDSEVSRASYRNLAERFGRVFLLCVRDGVKGFDPALVAGLSVEDAYLELAHESMVLVEGDLSMVNAPNHRNNLVAVHRDHLTGFNHRDAALNVEELVVLSPTPLRESAANEYVALFKPRYDGESLFRSLVVAKHHDVSWMNSVRQQIARIMENNSDTMFWEFPTNMTMSEEFTKRRFDFNAQLDKQMNKLVKSGEADATTVKLIRKLEDNNVSGTDYPVDTRRRVYTDGANAVKGSGGKRLYHITTPELRWTKDQVTEMFRYADNDHARYNLFNLFSLSKDMWHLAVNNQEVLEIMTPLFTKYRPIFRLVFGYWVMSAYLEECIRKRATIPVKDRALFTLDVASRLPYFPHADDLHQNPYIPLMVSNRLINADHNLMGLRPTMRDNHGITDQAGFQQRFNTFMVNNPDVNVFEGMDFRENNAAFTGSMISVCCLREHPLTPLVSTGGSENDNLRRLLEEYYGGSDVDLMCSHKSVFGFLDFVHLLCGQVSTNLKKANPDKDVTVNLEPIKECRISVTEGFLATLGDDVEHLKRNLNTDDVKEQINVQYVGCKSRQNKRYREKRTKEGASNPLDKDFFRMERVDEIDVRMMGSDKTREDVEEHDNQIYLYESDLLGEKKEPGEDRLMMIISEAIKYKIRSPHLQRVIEVFRIPYTFSSTVFGFHYPCVRGWFDGVTTYLMPSAVCALMSMVCVDSKYFASVRDPIGTSLKYFQRGYSAVLNETEINHMKRYIAASDQWKKYFGSVDLQNKSQTDKLVHPRELSDDLFHVKGIEMGVSDGIYRDVSDVRYVRSQDDLVQWYAARGYNDATSPLKLLSFTTIDSNGVVVPIQKWLLTAAWDLLNKSS